MDDFYTDCSPVGLSLQLYVHVCDSVNNMLSDVFQKAMYSLGVLLYKV